MGAALGAGLLAPTSARADEAEALIAAAMAEAAPFQASRMIDLARALSALPFSPPDEALPAQFDELSYESYIAIRSRPEAALFAGDGLAFGSSRCIAALSSASPCGFLSSATDG